METVESIGKAIHKSRRIVLITGAGISTSGGIPDFRSADGLYQLIKSKYPQSVLKGKDLFDANLFKDTHTTSIFYLFMAELRKTISRATVSKTHEFIHWLDQQNKLLRCYTQNIDSLEKRLGLHMDLEDPDAKRITKVVQLHGDLDELVCTLCKRTVDFNTEHIELFEKGKAPPCQICYEIALTRSALGKREISCGTLRPNIVLYNEYHCHGDVIADMVVNDIRRKPDLLIVMGTSLKVIGVKRLVKDIVASMQVKSPQSELFKKQSAPKVILINKTDIKGEWETIFDTKVIGESDTICEQLIEHVQKLNEKNLGQENAKVGARLAVDQIPFKQIKRSCSAPLKKNLLKEQDVDQK